MIDGKAVVLDAFCGGGGASAGYARGGAIVLGIDHKPQPDYQFPFAKMDALVAFGELERGGAVWFTPPRGGPPMPVWLSQIDLVHTSPPCQPYSITRFSHDNEHPELVPEVRDALRRLGVAYVIENVEGAPLEDPVLLCGEMFNLTARDDDGTELVLRRHRLFETSFVLGDLMHVHTDRRVAGVYGGGTSRRSPDDPSLRGGYTPRLHVRQELMELPGMKQRPLSQAIPPAYTEFVYSWWVAEYTTRMNRSAL